MKGCFGVIKDLTLPLEPVSEVSSSVPLRLLSEKTESPLLQDIFGTGTCFNSSKFRGGEMRAIVDLPYSFATFKEELLKAEHSDFGCYELDLLRACVRKSLDLRAPLPEWYMLPSGTPTRCLLVIAHKLLVQALQKVQAYSRDNGDCKVNLATQLS